MKSYRRILTNGFMSIIFIISFNSMVQARNAVYAWEFGIGSGIVFPESRPATYNLYTSIHYAISSSFAVRLSYDHWRTRECILEFCEVFTNHSFSLDITHITHPDKRISPYVGIGMGVLISRDTVQTDSRIFSRVNGTEMGLFLSTGLRMVLTKQLSVAFEPQVVFRKSFTTMAVRTVLSYSWGQRKALRVKP